MGKTTKWIRSFLTGVKKRKTQKKDKDAKISPNKTHPSPPIVANSTSRIPANPREKRRWSFRRSEAAPKDLVSMDPPFFALPDGSVSFDADIEHTKHAIAVTAVTIARLSSEEQLAAVTIQTLFRSYLARKALRALRGLVKLQALVRGHLVRRRATTTLRCLQALLSVQDRARAQRIRMVQQINPNLTLTHHHHQIQKHLSHRKTRLPFHEERDRGMEEENIRIVEMDICQASKNDYPNKPNLGFQLSPAPSDFTEISQITYDNHHTNESNMFTKSPLKSRSTISHPDRIKLRSALDESPSLSYDDYMSLHIPNYMANTQSSRAKARSQSAPRTRSGDSMERQCSRRKASVDHGRNIPIWMQRLSSSSAHIGSSPASAGPSYQFTFPARGGDGSAISVRESECGSNSTPLTNPNCCRGFIDFEVSDESLFSVITPTRP